MLGAVVDVLNLSVGLGGPLLGKRGGGTRALGTCLRLLCVTLGDFRRALSRIKQTLLKFRRAHRVRDVGRNCTPHQLFQLLTKNRNFVVALVERFRI